MGTLTPGQRRKCMQANKDRDTGIEVRLRLALWHKGYRYRKNYKGLPGAPDIAITKYHVAIFCDGEFWHGKDWDVVLKPRLLKGKNPEYWVRKIERNRERDRETDFKLLSMGWTVIHFWEGEIRDDVDRCVQVVEDAIFDTKIEEYDYFDSSLFPDEDFGDE